MVAVEVRWPNSTIACLAPGPSLTPDAVESVRGLLPVIAINEAVRLAPWADVVYSSDRGWWNRQRAERFHGQCFSVGRRSGVADAYVRLPHVKVLRHTGDTGLERMTSGLRTGQNSGYAAINLAVHLGARRILLLGYNMGPVEGRTHFYDGHAIRSPYRMFRDHFSTMTGPLKDAGVEVINCTPRSALTCFPVRDLSDVLADLKVVAA